SFHKDTTSQDVIDTSLMLRMKTAVEWIAQDCVEVLSGLQQLKDEIGNRELSARTRMQAALPFTLADRIEGWQEPIKSLYGDKPDYFPLQLGGPIGMMHKREPQWKDLVRLLAEDLELAPIARPWHTDRQPLVNLCSWMVALSTALGKMGQDITLMVQNGIDELGLKGGGSSSAMPHKNNPVLAETLVAIAQYNAGQMGLVHTAALHEQERSGISWTLEFMTIPQIVLACAGSVQIARKLITQLR
ncbi:MAG: lyase family protein, partial [Rhizobiaceae bacterium]|nr:lyase family protein [Rhizobiaceae bacterium]